MRQYISLGLFIAATICGVLAFTAFSTDEDSLKDIQCAEMPIREYLRYSQIARVYGSSAAEYWYAIFSNQPHLAEDIYDTCKLYGSEYQIDRAKVARFRVTADSKRDQDIMENYSYLRKKYPDLVRRQNFPERLKDSLAWIGALSVFAFIGYLIRNNKSNPF